MAGDVPVPSYSSPQILHDTLSEACLRISEDERLAMKALFGTDGRGGHDGTLAPPSAHCPGLSWPLPASLSLDTHFSVDSGNMQVPYLLPGSLLPSM